MTKNKLLKNISWLFFDKIIRIFGGLFVGIWVARYLGPSDFGILNYAMAYTALFMLFVNLGLDQIVVREIVKKTKLTNYFMGTVFGLKLVGAFIAIAAIYISLLFIETDTLTKTVIFIIAIGFIFQSIDIVDLFFQSRVLSKNVVIARNSAFILSSLLQIYFILNEYSVVYFAAAKTVDFILASVFMMMRYKKHGKHISRWKFSRKIAVRLLRYSWPLALSVFIISVYTKIDQVMIGNMLDSTQVGIFSVAITLSGAWLFVPTIFVSTFMPYFVKLRETDKAMYHLRLTQLYSLMFWIGASAGIVVIFFGDEIIRLLYGDVYVGAYEALIFNVWNGIFISQAIARGIWLISENLQRYRLYNNIFAVFLNVVANLILIPKYGISGAAVATLLTQGLGTWVFPFVWKPMRMSNLAMIKAINPMYLINYTRKEL